MDAEKIGKLISKLRHERKLTQKELADILGVSPKTISKWECGSGFPDIGMVKKISNELNITIEELLEGKKIENTKKTKFILFIIIGIIILVFIGISILINTTNNKIEKHDSDKTCKIVRTYYIDNISKSNNEDYIYVTIHEYQVEGIFTIKLSRLEGNNLVEGNSYEFIFNANSEYVSSTTDVLFENANIIGIEYSDKVGIDRTSTYNCN